MPDPSVVRKKLHSIADELVATGTSRRTSVRNLLSWFDFQRRGEWVVYTVRQALKEARLRTSPDFADVDGVGFDSFVEFELDPSENDRQDGQPKRQEEADGENEPDGLDTTAPWIDSFSPAACGENAHRMIEEYTAAGTALRGGMVVSDVTGEYDAGIKWDADLRRHLSRDIRVVYDRSNIHTTQYRPFVGIHCYVDYLFAQRKHQLDHVFPTGDHTNRAICIPGIGSTKPFSALLVGRMPDLHCVSFGQCFPRWRYEQQDAHQRDLLTGHHDLVRIDNISETALRRFRVEYGDRSITGDDIFDYVYGVLHSPQYRNHFANDLAKGLPRIPFALDFRAFADAGAVLAELHLNYEDADFPEHPLEVVSSTGLPLKPSDFRLGTRPMRFADKERRDTLIVNDRVQLAGIPPEAHRYVVNGRTPLEWLNYYYKAATDKRSGIVNDANEWFRDPRDLVTTIRRIVYLSVETARIVDGLPDPLPEEMTEFTFELEDA